MNRVNADDNQALHYITIRHINNLEGFMCGGEIIAIDYVVTATHCFAELKM